MSLRVAIALLVVMLFVIFGAQNTEPVELQFFFWQLTIPASVTVVGAFACGVIVGALLFWTEQRRLQRRQVTANGPVTAKKKTSWWW